MSSISITKVIFIQRFARFAGRTVEDLVIMNFVCKDFEETMQAHHTFNLVLYDNIIKKRKEEEDFFDRSVKVLATAPAWIVYQWTVVNEHDETQREWLSELLLHQSDSQSISIRDKALLLQEDSATTHQLLRHILDSCVRLGIISEFLTTHQHFRYTVVMTAIESGVDATFLSILLQYCAQFVANIECVLKGDDSEMDNVIMVAIIHWLAPCSFKILLDFCETHGFIKSMLESSSPKNRNNMEKNAIVFASSCRLPAPSFQILLDYCQKHAAVYDMLGSDSKANNNNRNNAIMIALRRQLPPESLRVLLEFCSKHYPDKIAGLLTQRNHTGCNCLHIACEWNFAVDGVRVLISYFPTKDLLQSSLLEENDNEMPALDLAGSDEVRALLADPDCWTKCREWMNVAFH